MDPKEALEHYTQQKCSNGVQLKKDCHLSCNKCAKKDVCRYLLDVNSIVNGIILHTPNLTTPLDMSFLNVDIGIYVDCKHYLKEEEL